MSVMTQSFEPYFVIKCNFPAYYNQSASTLSTPVWDFLYFPERLSNNHQRTGNLLPWSAILLCRWRDKWRLNILSLHCILLLRALSFGIWTDWLLCLFIMHLSPCDCWTSVLNQWEEPAHIKTSRPQLELGWKWVLVMSCHLHVPTYPHKKEKHTRPYNRRLIVLSSASSTIVHYSPQYKSVGQNK